jgi:hypothetical protein
VVGRLPNVRAQECRRSGLQPRRSSAVPLSDSGDVFARLLLADGALAVAAALVMATRARVCEPSEP